MTTDPVCGMRVDERESEFRTQFAGKKMLFLLGRVQKGKAARGVPGDSGVEAVGLYPQAETLACVGTGALARPSRAQLGSACGRSNSGLCLVGYGIA